MEGMAALFQIKVLIKNSQPRRVCIPHYIKYKDWRGWCVLLEIRIVVTPVGGQDWRGLPGASGHWSSLLECWDPSNELRVLFRYYSDTVDFMNIYWAVQRRLCPFLCVCYHSVKKKKSVILKVKNMPYLALAPKTTLNLSAASHSYSQSGHHLFHLPLSPVLPHLPSWLDELSFSSKDSLGSMPPPPGSTPLPISLHTRLLAHTSPFAPSPVFSLLMTPISH